MTESLTFNIFLPLFTGLSIAFDTWQKRIPNWLILVGIVGGLLFNALKGMPELYGSLLGMVTGIGILIIPFALGWLGAGDVKLFGALGAIVSLKLIPRLFFYSAIAGAVLALISLAFMGGMRGSRTVPYGIAIGLGALISLYFDPDGRLAGF
jgi:prepilin peptidase CpaA